MRGFLWDNRVQIVAVCDVNRQNNGYWDNRTGGREPAKRIVTEHYARTSAPGSYKGCKSYEDFRDVLARFECIYKNGVKLIVSNKVRGGVTFEGTEGWVWADRGRHDAKPVALVGMINDY